MASTIRQRLRRFNGTDYDSIYLSANVGDVVGVLPVNHGGTGRTSVDTTPTSGSSNMCTSGGIYDALQSTSGEDIIQIYAPGNMVIFDGKLWICVHIEGAYAYLLHYTTVGYATKFGNNVTYRGSTLASIADQWQSSCMSPGALELCQTVTVEGVTSKVFVPSYMMMCGHLAYTGTITGSASEVSWEYMKCSPIAGNSANTSVYRAAADVDGNPIRWWLSSKSATGTSISVVESSGYITNASPTNDVCGFRPAIKVKYKSNSSKWQGDVTVGNIITWCGVDWRIVHNDTTNKRIYIAKETVYGTSGTAFNTDANVSGMAAYLTRYCNSNLAKVAKYYSDTLQWNNPTEFDYVVDVTIHTVTGKIWAPAHGMIASSVPSMYVDYDGTNNYSATSGTYSTSSSDSVYPRFSYFNYSYNANAENRICRDDNGNLRFWWVATAMNKSSVWSVNANGNASASNGPTANDFCFRPFACLQY